MSHLRDLEAAAALWTRGERREALTTLLTLWQRWKVARLGDLIVRLTVEASKGRAPIRPSGARSSVEVWREVEAARDPLDLPRLLEPIPKATTGVQRGRVEALVAWPAHPLLVRTALEWLSGHKVTVFTAELAAMIERVEDPSLSARLAELGPNLMTATRFVGRRQAKVIVALAEAAAAWREPGVSSAEAAALDGFEGSAKLAAAEDTASLFAKVYAAPGDDALRALLADALVAAGDPRGEFMSMQLLRGDAAPSKAEKKLEAEWRDAWLGRLAPCFRKGVVFRRGFPAEGAYEKSGDPSWPEWATFEALDLMPASGFMTGGVGILVKAPLKSLRKVTRIGRPVLDEVPGEPTIFELDDVPWHTVGFQCVEAFGEALPKLLTARRFPKVHTFHLDTPPGWHPPSDALLGPLLKLPWFSQVTHLEVAVGPGALATALTAKVQSLVLKDHAGLSRAEYRASEGRLALVIEAIAPRSLDLLVALVQVLSDTRLAHVSLELPRCKRQGSVVIASAYKKVDLAPLLTLLARLAPARLDLPEQ